MKRPYASIDDFMREEQRSQRWIAKAVGITPAYLSQIRSRKRTPSLEKALALARICRVPLETLLRRAA